MKTTAYLLMLILTVAVTLGEEPKPTVELLKISRNMLYQPNNSEYRGSRDNLPVRTFSIVLKINHPKGIGVTNVNSGKIYLITGDKKVDLASFGKTTYAMVGFDTNRYRRAYGEILNNDLGNCTISEHVIFNPTGLPDNFDILVENCGINGASNSIRIKNVSIKE